MSAIGNLFGGGQSSPIINRGQYQQYAQAGLQGNEALQAQALQEAQNPYQMPDVAGAEFANALNASRAGVASEVGGMKGLSPAAMSQLISQGGATAAGTGAGQAAVAGMQQGVQQQQLHQQQEQIAGGLQSAAINPTLSYQSAANNAAINAYGTEQQAGSQQLGSAISAVGSLAAGLLSKGGQIPGTPKVDHDSPDNDDVHALLTPGEGVLPLSVMKAPDAPERAAAFVAALKKTGKPPGKGSLDEVMASHKKLGEALKRWKGGEA